MAHADEAHLEVVLHFCGEFEEAELVGHGNAVLAHAPGKFVLGEAALVHQPLIAEGQFDGVQILALDILDDGHFQHALFIGILDICGNHIQARHDAGAVAALTADYLVVLVAGLADGDGLDQSQVLDGGR